MVVHALRMPDNCGNVELRGILLMRVDGEVARSRPFLVRVAAPVTDTPVVVIGYCPLGERE